MLKPEIKLPLDHVKIPIEFTPLELTVLMNLVEDCVERIETKTSTSPVFKLTVNSLKFKIENAEM